MGRQRSPIVDQVARPGQSLGRRLLAYLPQGLPVEDGTWRRRHRVILALAWVHVPVILAFAWLGGHGLEHGAVEAAVVAACASVAGLPRLLPKAWVRWDRSARATVAGLGLIASSAFLTHLSGGLIEMHFHFFVMVAVMALYQDWPPFLLAILFVGAHHAIVGSLDPASVYDHASGRAAPLQWAALHAFFILCASAAAVTSWKLSEVEHLRTRAANEQLRRSVSLIGATLESTVDGILVVDREGRVAGHNQQFIRLWGLPSGSLQTRSREEALAIAVGQLRDPDAFVAMRGGLYGSPDAEAAGSLELKDGRVFEYSSKPQRLDGVAVGRVWSFRDVTERRRAEADRLVAGERLMEIRRLEEVSRFKTQLLNTASHELNTPLTPLLLQLRLLQGTSLGDLNERQRRSVDVLDRNLQRLTSLVRNVLDVARVQGSRLKLDPVEVDLVRLGREAAEAFEGVALEGGVRLTVHPTPKALPVRADPERTMQVLFNLLSNAFKFTPPGGSVTLRFEERDGVARAVVSDSGRGLQAQEIAQLFQPFAQVGPAFEQKAGTGLGLYICKGLVEAQGGAIGVASGGLGQGSSFWFTVPLASHAESRDVPGAILVAARPRGPAAAV